MPDLKIFIPINNNKRWIGKFWLWRRGACGLPNGGDKASGGGVTATPHMTIPKNRAGGNVYFISKYLYSNHIIYHGGLKFKTFNIRLVKQ